MDDAMTLRFRLLGFPVSIDSSFWILAAVVVLFGLRSAGLSYALSFVAVAFVSILVHELGHALVSRRFGLGPVEIELHSLGGLARRARAGKPWQALLITLAGPGAGLLFGVLALGAAGLGLQGFAAVIVGQLVFVNVVWSLFNLVPLWPLDGGKALYSILEMAAPAQALPVTAVVGMAIGAGGVLWSLQAGEVFILLIAGMSAWQNYQMFADWQARRGRRR
jgi:Zn-dependent protease